jgi:hypothetical protein
MMSNFGEFGQLASILSAANDAQLMAANALLADRKRKGEQKLAKYALLADKELQKLDLSFREKELVAKMQASNRRDALFKDIALYGGIGIATLVILITVGVMFVGAKKESQFEYLIEGRR